MSAMKKIIFAILGLVALCAFVLTVWLIQVFSELPDVALLKHYRPPAAAEVLDKDGGLMMHLYDRAFRIWVPIASLPDVVINAVVTAEDDTFFEHGGVNLKATRDALLHDVQKRRFARGGSTITQQMIKNVLLTKEKTLSRKLREYVLARRAEQVLTKYRILEIYLNEVEWGENLYGIEAASRFYLDKHAAELTSAEAALLAGMLPNPRYYNPYKRPEKARKRQEQVLFNMQQAKLIPQDEYVAALRTPLRLRQEGAGRMDLSFPAVGSARPCYQQALEEILVGALGWQKVYRSGGVIRTTLEKSLQNEISLGEAYLRDRQAKPSGSILAVWEGGRIRAVACNKDREAEIRTKLDFSGMAARGYTTNTVAPGSITPEQILLTDGSASP